MRMVALAKQNTPRWASSTPDSTSCTRRTTSSTTPPGATGVQPASKQALGNPSDATPWHMAVPNQATILLPGTGLWPRYSHPGLDTLSKAELCIPPFWRLLWLDLVSHYPPPPSRVEGREPVTHLSSYTTPGQHLHCLGLEHPH